MNEVLQNQILKHRNIWPTSKEENWKYFDFKAFELLTKDLKFKKSKLEIKYSSDLNFEIKMGSNQILIAENLKNLIAFDFVENQKLLNEESSLDFRLTTLNLEGTGFKISIKNQKELNLTLTYNSNESVLDSLNLFLILMIEDSNLNLLEQDLGNRSKYFSNHLQLQLQNSKVEHITLFANSSEEGAHRLVDHGKIYNSEIKVGSNSFYKNTSVFLKNQFIRVQQSLCLESEGSVGHLNAFNISENQNFSELRTEVIHLKRKTKSSQLYKTIAADQSQSVFNGRIYVDSIAQKTDASQLCRGVLLSSKAEINAKPELEIYADDVKAMHGAAIGQLGQDQIFYLVSRGIKPELAFRILSKAFAGEVLSCIENLEFKKLCQMTIDKSSETVFKKLAESINLGREDI